jgi:hypothetical protein
VVEFWLNALGGGGEADRTSLLWFQLSLRLQHFQGFGIEMQFVLYDLRTPRGILGQRVAAIELHIGRAQALECEAGEEAGADEQGLAGGGIGLGIGFGSSRAREIGSKGCHGAL